MYKQTNETTTFAMAGDWKIYIWINLVKNPRLRVLSEPTLAISITIPKAFTFANVAIRVYHQIFNPLLESSNIYTSVVGLLLTFREKLFVSIWHAHKILHQHPHIISLSPSHLLRSHQGDGKVLSKCHPPDTILESLFPNLILIFSA